MSPEFVCRVLGWCTLFNLLLLVWWFVFYWAAHDWMYELHHRLFKLSVETFDAIR